MKLGGENVVAPNRGAKRRWVVGLGGELLFAVLFLWQVPHFAAITIFRAQDYARAGLMVVSVQRGENGAKADAEHTPAKRRLGAMAAVVALAIIAGAAGGAFATMGMMHTADAVATAPAPAGGALEAAIARIDAEVVALKNGLDHTSKTALTQFNKTTDRLDRIEKAQAEPSAKIAKLSEAVEKLRAAPLPVVATAAPAMVAPAAPNAAPMTRIVKSSLLVIEFLSRSASTSGVEPNSRCDDQ